MLSAKNITKYREGDTVLESVDIDVEPGTITALIGPSGAGKTTLLNVLSFSLFPVFSFKKSYHLLKTDEHFLSKF